MEKTARTQKLASAGTRTAAVLMPAIHLLSSMHTLHLAWKSNTASEPAGAFAVSIASHLFDSCNAVLVETRDCELLNDLDLDELVTLIRRKSVAVVTFGLSRGELAGAWRLELMPPSQNPRVQCRLGVPVCEHTQPWAQVWWLQARFDHPSPVPALPVPYGPGGVSISIFHGLVELAARFGPVQTAELERCTRSARSVTVARWCFDTLPKGENLVSTSEEEALWLTTPTLLSGATNPLCWVEHYVAGTEYEHRTATTPDAAWQQRFAALLATLPLDGGALAAHLQALAPVPVPFRIGPLNTTPALAAMAPPHAGVICVLVPTASEVHIGIDFAQDPNVIK